DITPSALGNGLHSFNASFNLGTHSSSFAVTIDTVAAAPSAPDLQAADDSGSLSTDNITNVTTPHFSGNGAEAGATVTLYDTNGTTVLGTGTADGSGNWTITSSALSDGGHTLTVKETDIAGNTSTASTGLAVTVDTTAPAQPSITEVDDNKPLFTGPVANGGITNDSTPTVTVSLAGTGAVAGDTVQLYEGTTLLGTVTLNHSDIVNGVTTITPSALSDGLHTFSATITDAAGNPSVVSGGYAVTIDTTAPVAVADSGSANEAGIPAGSDATGNVLANDTDVDNTNAQLSVSEVNGAGANVGASVDGLHGSVTINADGSYTYVVNNA